MFRPRLGHLALTARAVVQPVETVLGGELRRARLRDAARSQERKEVENPVRDGRGVIDLTAIEPTDPARKGRPLPSHDRPAGGATAMHGPRDHAHKARFARRRTGGTVYSP